MNLLNNMIYLTNFNNLKEIKTSMATEEEKHIEKKNLDIII